MWTLLALILGVGIGCAFTLLGVLVWMAIRLHQRFDNDAIYERPNFYYRSEN